LGRNHTSPFSYLLKKKDKTDFNYLEFLGLLTITAIIAGISFWYRITYLSHWSPFANTLFRAVRMTIIYVGFPVIYAKIKKIDIKQWGIGFPKNVTGFLLGLGVYGLVTLVFWKYRIFYDSLQYSTIKTLYTTMPLICLMAAITDFWTRGFVLLTLEKEYGWFLAILTQNIFWFLLHFYEVVWISPYISFWGAVALTVGLGFLGDMVALHYKNIWGLMIGHALLNIISAGLASNWYGLVSG